VPQKTDTVAEKYSCSDVSVISFTDEKHSGDGENPQLFSLQQPIRTTLQQNTHPQGQHSVYCRQLMND